MGLTMFTNRLKYISTIFGGYVENRLNEKIITFLDTEPQIG